VSNSSYTQKYLWTLKRIISSGLTLIDVSANPTYELPEIVIRSNTLDYGLYEFTVHVEIQLMSYVFKNEQSTYVEIIPTGLVVYGIENGVQSILIGYRQTLTLNPVEYSFDFDNLAAIKNFTFKFFCSPSSKYNYSISSLVSASDIDLATYKRNSSLQINSCFTSSGKKTNLKI
jgi:hypothetical protein